MKTIVTLTFLLLLSLATLAQFDAKESWHKEEKTTFKKVDGAFVYETTAYSTTGTEYSLVKKASEEYKAVETRRYVTNDTLSAYDEKGNESKFIRSLPSKWFPGESYNYIGWMQTGFKTSTTILMVGGEKPVCQINEKTKFSFWYFGYLDKTIGYGYCGPSLSKDFTGGYISLGVGAGFTSTDEFIYAFTLMGEKDKFSWFANTEHGVWNWHRIIAGYRSLIVGSQSFLGPGCGGKAKLTPDISLEIMVHTGINKSYFGSLNDQGGMSLNLIISL